VLRVAFVYPNSRTRLVEEVARGEAPDTGLLGQNHLAELGIDAFVHEPRVRHLRAQGGLVHRLTWHARELALPLELRGTDVLCTPLVNLAPLAARALRRPRVVVLNYGISTVYDRSSTLRRRILKQALASSSAVVCLGESQRGALLEQLPLDPTRVRVVPLGVDERFHAASPPPRRGHVLAVGRDLARDYATLAAAARLYDAPTILVAEERNLVGVELPDNVTTVRGIPFVRLRELYEGARCIVLPLRHEGYRLGTEGGGLTALLEAMASGRPIVATQRPIVEDYVKDGETALLAPPEEPEAIAVLVRKVLDDDGLAARLGAAARQRVEERHTTRLFAERLAAILREAA
jgi:glycosyltransferase involved in cell wall biosynthesis